MDKIKIGGVIAIIAVLMLVVSLGMPWYTITHEYEEGESTNQRMSLDLLPRYSHSEEDTPIENQTTTFSITSWIATVGTGASVLSLLFIGIAIGSDSKKHAKIGTVLLVIGLIFAIIAPIYLMISYPNAVLGDEYDGDEEQIPEERDDTRAESFFGSDSYEDWRGEIDESWGGGIGWFMSLIGGILLVLSLILVALAGKSTPQQGPVRGAGMTQPRQNQGWSQQQQGPREQYPQEEEWTQEPQQQRMQEEQPKQQGWAQQSQQQQVQQQPSQQPRQQQTQPGTQQTQQSNTCPDCGQPIRYIEEYNSWYCDSCQEYK